MLLFVLSVILVLSALLYAIYRYKYKNWQKQQKSSRDQPHFTFKI